jgi:hypothetical protein
MKIWLDDLRDPPDDSWKVARTYDECRDFIMCFVALDDDDSIECISLDHDLGEEKTGYDVVKLIEELVVGDYNYFPPKMFIHSANPVGRLNIQRGIAAINAHLTNRLAEYWGLTN